MAPRSAVCLPSYSKDQQSSEQYIKAGSGSDTYDSLLAPETLVLQTNEGVSVLSMEIAKQTGSTSTRSNLPSRPSLAPVHRLEIEREDLEQSGLPREAVDIMVQARRNAFSGIYNHMWVTLKKWSNNKKLDPLKPTYKYVHYYFFLREGWKQGLKLNN